MLELVNLSKRFGTRSGVETAAFNDVSLTVADKEFLCIVGPSGCGKTTLLRCISGLLEPSEGVVTLNGRAISGPPLDMAFVFQDYGRSLLPWMTARQNVAFPLRYRDIQKTDRQRLTMEALTAVGLGEFLDHYPWQMSGGMQQRVAIARAIAFQPKVLLMDEPFASVDAQTRAELEDLLLGVHAEFGVTVAFVTHDIDQAVYLGDRVVILNRPPEGLHRVVAVDLPRPRSQMATKALPEYAALRNEVWGEITASTV